MSEPTSLTSTGTGSFGSASHLPWHLIPAFEPGETDLKEYSRRLEFLAGTWPPEHLEPAGLLVLPYNTVARPFRRWWDSSQNNWKWILLRGSNSSWRRWVASGGKLCWKTSTPNLNVQSLGCLKRLTKAMKAMWQGMKSCLKIWLLKEPLWATCGPTCCPETQPWRQPVKAGPSGQAHSRCVHS